MAIQLGIESKKQVYQLLGLVGVALALLIYNLVGTSTAKKNTVPPPSVAVIKKSPGANGKSSTASASSVSSGPAAEKISGPSIDPSLHLDKLAETEAIIYAGTGRNIFSADSAPVITRAEAALASARATPAAAIPIPVPSAPEPPKAPPIDLKYFGYTETKDKNLRAFFAHGDDIFVAHVGEIVDHRYKVESIQPDSVKITDMSYNNTQSVPLTLK